MILCKKKCTVCRRNLCQYCIICCYIKLVKISLTFSIKYLEPHIIYQGYLYIDVVQVNPHLQKTQKSCPFPEQFFFLQNIYPCILLFSFVVCGSLTHNILESKGSRKKSFFSGLATKRGGRGGGGGEGSDHQGKRTFLPYF